MNRSEPITPTLPGLNLSRFRCKLRAAFPRLSLKRYYRSACVHGSWIKQTACPARRIFWPQQLLWSSERSSERAARRSLSPRMTGLSFRTCGVALSLILLLRSPGINAALKPLDRLMAQASEIHKRELKEFESRKKVREAQREGMEYRMKSIARKSAKVLRLVPKDKPAEPEPQESLESLASKLQEHERDVPKPPTLRRYKTNDATTEKLGELLRDNPAGLLVLRDELVGLIASWDREGREGDRAFMLESWNGDSSFDTDRIGRGSIPIPNLCLSVFGGLQPDKLTIYLEQTSHALANDGMLQRFQVLVFPIIVLGNGVIRRRTSMPVSAPSTCSRRLQISTQSHGGQRRRTAR